MANPLRKLIDFAQIINDSSIGMDKRTSVQLSIEEIPKGVFQIGDLTDGFKKMMGDINIRSTKSRTRKHRVDDDRDIYPFNDLDSEYLQKSERKSLIDWDNLIDSLPVETAEKKKDTKPTAPKK